MKVQSRFTRNFNFQVPRKIVEKLGLFPFDLYEIEVKDDGFFVKPLWAIEKDQIWLWSPNWQKYLKAAKDDIAKKRVLVYRNADELSEFLFKKIKHTMDSRETREIKGRPVLKEKEGIGLTHTFYSRFGYYAQERMDGKNKKKVRDVFEIMLRDPFDRSLKVESVKGMEGKWICSIDEKRVIIFSVRDRLVFLEHGGNKEHY